MITSVTPLPISTSELLEEAERHLQNQALMRQEYLDGKGLQRSAHRIEIRWRLALAQVFRLKRQLAVERHAMQLRPDTAQLTRLITGIDRGLSAIGVEDRVVARVQSWQD